MAFTQEQVRRFKYARESFESGGKAHYPHDVRWDSDLKGFGVRVMPSGRKSWILKYRNGEGITRLMVLADTEKLDAKKARKRALDELAKVHGSKARDPLQERDDERMRPTVAQLAQEYVAEHLPKKRARSRSTDGQMLDNWILPALKGKRVAAVKRRDIEHLHQSMAQFPTQANRVLSLASKMFSRAVEWEYRPDNPVKGIERFPETPRERYLTGAELTRLGEALDAHDYLPAVAIVRLCLLTGARSGEVMSARWQDFDDEEFVRLALEQIVGNLVAKKPPGADEAFRLTAGRGNPHMRQRRQWRRNQAICAHLYQLIVREDWKPDAAFLEVGKHFGLQANTIRGVWARLPRSLKRPDSPWILNSPE